MIYKATGISSIISYQKLFSSHIAVTELNLKLFDDKDPER